MLSSIWGSHEIIVCGLCVCQILLSSVEGWEESSVTQDEIGQRIVTALKRVWS